jgi:hypothetical protein
MIRLRRLSRTRLRLGLFSCLVLGIAVAAAVPSASGSRADLPGYPEQPDLISLAPLSETNWVGEQVTHTATISASEANRVGTTVTFTVLQGPSEGRTFTAETDSSGSASFTYTIPAEGQPLPTLPNAGADQIQASFFDGKNTIGSNWVGQGWSQGAVGETVPGRPPALVQTPGATGFTAANTTQDLPPGTTVDISGDRGMSILNYFSRRMTFLGVADGVPSRFVLINGLRTPGKPIRIRLTGGNFGQCTSKNRKFNVHSTYDKKKPGKPVRRLWGTGKGRYETKGKYASATVRGTFWLVADYCDGTLVKVRTGTVVVRDLVTGKTIVVTSGHAYFAKKP